MVSSRAAAEKLCAKSPTKNGVVNTPTRTMIEVVSANIVSTASATREASFLSPRARRFAYTGMKDADRRLRVTFLEQKLLQGRAFVSRQDDDH